ncbi:MAG: elongation factor 4 [Candidatus Harrisonbacteria bacterium CG10_big_fil_rev_8_21_14_0_10_49_15]|uniref:Elongation factor 4 n=1 Tax=Candidatus Harrisonbacteria bacterium CG10_big_fil_rev_8_21_14_0_10_49_15 TaxID=1974587 RepID=A0A2H0UKL9_9BACT|nr:MAG: elongation factor 4 [Candidatus Harrisonbacteria bacterium CG10_big_fil_rev_8_21_14_0_10_49_15]
MQNIRNYVIIAHIDHGKSTLADRMLELTKTVEARKMQAQYLDGMDLERERGITIKMTPVRMIYKYHAQSPNPKHQILNKSQISNSKSETTDSEQEFVLNLIDTPGHSDFGYEVSRALNAVEGAILLVDATQGVQAQTLYNFEMAKRAKLKIIGAVNKVDMATPEQIQDSKRDVAELIASDPSEIFECSGKTGQGVPELLEAVVEQVPPPHRHPERSEGSRDSSPAAQNDISRGLVFDSQYDEHKGIIAFIRVFSGSFSLNKNYYLVATGAEAKTKDIGYLRPGFTTSSEIKMGEIGYVATGIKDPDALNIGDTLTDIKPSSVEDPKQLALPGYREPKPVLYVSFYPENSEDYDDFKKALSKLRLSDSALIFEPDSSEVLGRGFKAGFLGRLHLDIVVERIKREFHIPVVSSFPSVAYKVKLGKYIKGDTEEKDLEPAGDGMFWVKNPKELPSDPAEIFEPMTRVEILTPTQYLGAVLSLSELYRMMDMETNPLVGSSDKMLVTAKVPLADLISDFDDKLKSVSQGYASLNYELIAYERANVDKLEILVAESVVPGLTRILPKADLEREGRRTVEKLKELLPKQQFPQALQASWRGKIIARETLAAFKKELGNFGKNGGDRTRKMKLWKKQARGKERLKERGVQSNIQIPQNVFKELLKK